MRWPYVKLSELAEFKNGLNYSKDSWGVGLKVIGVANFKDYLYPKYDELDQINPKGVVRETDYLKENDILFVRSNGNRELIGRTLLLKDLKERVSHSGFTIRARFFSEKVYVPFYFYLFRSSLIRAVLSIYGGGTNINNLNQGILSNLNVPLPEINEQKKIASVLSAYDDLIENNKRRIALLEKMAEEIYREWFVRFRFPGYQTAEFEKGFPTNWEPRKFESFCRFDKGKNPEEVLNMLGDDLVPYVNIDTLSGNANSFARPQKNSVMCNAADILMIMDGSRSGLVFRSNVDGVVGSTLSVIRVEETLRHFVFEYLRAMQEAIVFNNTGSAIPHANKDYIKRMILFVPKDDSLITEFNNKYESIYKLVTNIKNHNEKLMQTKEMLLPRLISGKLSVADLDIQFPPSMVDDEAA